MDADPFVESRLNCCATVFVDCNDGAGVDSWGTPFCDKCAIAQVPIASELFVWLRLSSFSCMCDRTYAVEAFLTMMHNACAASTNAPPL